MTYRLVDIFIKDNPVSNDSEYFCLYYANNGSLVKARITKSTFEKLKKDLPAGDKISTVKEGVKK